jgi:hypothetical protein
MCITNLYLQAAFPKKEKSTKKAPPVKDGAASQTVAGSFYSDMLR